MHKNAKMPNDMIIDEYLQKELQVVDVAEVKF